MKKNNKNHYDLVDSILDSMKAEEIVKVDLSQSSALYDYAFIATGTSDRHISAIGDKIKEAYKDLDLEIRVEGKGSGWVLIDTGDIIVHLFQEESRLYYNLEGLWKDKQ